MKVAAFMALKSLRRGDVRVLLLTVSMLILVYINLVFTPSLLAGAVQKINEKTRNTLSGDIVVQSDNYPVIVRAQEDGVSHREHRWGRRSLRQDQSGD